MSSVFAGIANFEECCGVSGVKMCQEVSGFVSYKKFMKHLVKKNINKYLI